MSLFQHFISTTRILRVRDLLTYCAGKNVGSDVWLFMPAIWSKLFKMFPLLRNDGTAPPPHVKTRESPPYLICVSTHCTHTISHFSAVASSLSVLPPRPGRPCCSHENIQHIPTHTLTNTYAHIKAILCRLIVIHCGYGNQMPFPSQFSSVVFLSLPNLCVQIPPTSTSHLWSSVPAILL